VSIDTLSLQLQLLLPAEGGCPIPSDADLLTNVQPTESCPAAPPMTWCCSFLRKTEISWASRPGLREAISVKPVPQQDDIPYGMIIFDCDHRLW